MKKRAVMITFTLLFAFLIICSSSSVIASNSSINQTESNVSGEVTIDIFYGKGCPHCSKLLEFAENLEKEYSYLRINKHEVYVDKEERRLFQKFVEVYNTEIKGVPTTFIDDEVLVGFSYSIGDKLLQRIERCHEEGCINPSEKIASNETLEIIGDSSPSEDPEATELKKKITIPIVLGGALVDAINPCAFAVLIILMSTILVAKKKKRALFAGLAFTISIYISYFLMGLGLFSAIQAAGLTTWFYVIVSFLAILIGLFNLKDYLWYGKWFKMEVPESWRPKMKAVLKSVTSVPGAFLIGFVISLFLLPCTSGPYLVILGLLAHTSTKAYAIGLLLLYNLVFIIPMLVITIGIYLGYTNTKKAEKWRKRKLKVLHLIAGSLLILLGLGMLFSIYMGWV